MRYYGTVKTFDPATGLGDIRPEVAANDLRFERGAITGESKIDPTVGQRLSYDVGQGADRQPTAVNLQIV